MENYAYRHFALGSVLLAGIVGVLASAGACRRAAAQGDPLLHKPAPLFVRNDLDSQRVDLATMRGRVVLLSFWATWCASCLIEMPRFVQWQNEHNAEGFQIIGISMDDDPALVQTLLRTHKVNYPIVMGDEELGLQYGGVLGLPVTYIIDRQGIVRAHYKGDADLKAMEAEVRKLLETR